MRYGRFEVELGISQRQSDTKFIDLVIVQPVLLGSKILEPKHFFFIREGDLGVPPLTIELIERLWNESGDGEIFEVKGKSPFELGNRHIKKLYKEWNIIE